MRYDYVNFINNIPIVPWYPEKLTDIDAMGHKLMEVKDEVN